MHHTRTFFSVPHQWTTFSTYTAGELGTKSWRLFFKSSECNRIISPWHDIPRRPGCGGKKTDLPKGNFVFTYVNEIPRGSRVKMELLKEEAYNPISQDILKKVPGQPLRFFSYGDLPFNYGFIPQTWENPNILDRHTKCVGDGDPIDVVCLGSTPAATGQLIDVRVLGVLGLIDQNETDWKIISEPVSTRDGGYGSLKHVPNEVKKQIIEWFKNYKTLDGKPPNEFAFNGEICDMETALQIISDCAQEYDWLIDKKINPNGYWLPH